MPFSIVRPLPRGVYYPLPVLSEAGFPMAIAVAAPRRGEAMGRQIRREIIRPGVDAQAVINELWQLLNDIDPPERVLRVI